MTGHTDPVNAYAISSKGAVNSIGNRPRGGQTRPVDVEARQADWVVESYPAVMSRYTRSSAYCGSLSS